MADFSLHGEGQIAESVGRNTGSSTLTDVASDSFTNSKGSWVQLASSTSFDAQGFILHLNNYNRNSSPSPVAGNVLIDIGVGSSGNEVVIVGNMPFSSMLAAGYPSPLTHVNFPIGIKAGSRIAARCQASSLPMSGGTIIPMAVTLYGQGFESSEPMSGCTTYGVDTGSSACAPVSNGGSANTRGAWTQITSATSNDAVAMIVCLGIDNASSDYNGLLTIGVGADLSEVVIIDQLPFQSTHNSGGVPVPPIMGPIPVQIPAGTRVAAAWAGSVSSINVPVAIILLEP